MFKFIKELTLIEGIVISCILFIAVMYIVNIIIWVCT